jgi:23S rRNA pseudouridine1911/1915/1917 synthase
MACSGWESVRNPETPPARRVTPEGVPRELVIASADRADRAVATVLGISRAAALELIGAGQVRQAGKRLTKGERLEAGAVLELRAAVPSLAVVPQPELPLPVLLERPSLLVLDKQAGIASHPLKAGELGTLANALVARFPACLAAGTSEREAGLCHRLDRETSGAILAARTPEAFANLRGQFRRREVEKVYLALVQGRPEASTGSIEVPLGGRGALTRPWRSERDGRERQAITHTRLLWSDGESSLLEVRIETGVRHQIRAHLSALGHPLRGDVSYGAAPWSGLPRHLLHAWRLGFRDPETDALDLIEAPLPADARAALAELGAPLEAPWVA